jgi:1-acyl-sn-glycerol-3-phosphate acyltransferase
VIGPRSRRRVPGRKLIRLFFWWDFVRLLLRLAFGYLYRIEYRGRQYVPRRGPAIYVANHQSHLDPPMVGTLVHDRPFTSIARSTLYRWPLGPMIRSIGTISIERGRSDTTAVRAALRELERGRCVLIFPEGARCDDGRTAPFKRGISLLLRRSRVPVIPIAVEGNFDAWPRSRSLPRLRGRVAAMAGPPLDPDELIADPAALETLRRLIESMRMELRDRIRRTSRGRWPPPGPADQPYWVEPGGSHEPE